MIFQFYMQCNGAGPLILQHQKLHALASSKRMFYSWILHWRNVEQWYFIRRAAQARTEYWCLWNPALVYSQLSKENKWVKQNDRWVHLVRKETLCEYRVIVAAPADLSDERAQGSTFILSQGLFLDLRSEHIFTIWIRRKDDVIGTCQHALVMVLLQTNLFPLCPNYFDKPQNLMNTVTLIGPSWQNHLHLMFVWTQGRVFLKHAKQSIHLNKFSIIGW